MKFTDYITWLILCVGVCIGCSDKEEVVPSDLKDNYFAVPDDATDPESLLRKFIPILSYWQKKSIAGS